MPRATAQLLNCQFFRKRAHSFSALIGSFGSQCKKMVCRCRLNRKYIDIGDKT